MDRGLILQQVSLCKGHNRLLTVDHAVAPGEILTIMGPSGSGKSTLLSFVIGTLPTAFTAAGRVFLDGDDVTTLPPEARRMGILFQDDLLFPHLSVGGNLAFGLAGRRRDRRTRVEAALAEIGLAGYATRDPATLSGGQKTRVALMRMLLSEPRALLLDEPFSRLDTAMREQVRKLVFDIARARGLPVLLVTHDADDARAAAGDVLSIG